MTLPSGVTVTPGYDNNSAVTSIEWQSKAGSQTQPLGSLEYRFDGAGRLAGQRGTSARITIPQERSASFDEANRLTKLDGAAIAYDENGNLRSAPGASYTWNARNELILASIDGVTTTLGYDPQGRRIRSSNGATTLTYRYDGDQLLTESPPTGGTTSYLRDPTTDTALSRTDPAGTSALLTDALGSTIDLVKQTSATIPASITTSYTYEPYGAATSDNPTDPNPIRYTGRESGPSLPAGLQSNRARYYHVEVGRFISEDPIGILPASTNLYEYAGGDPINRIDPYGTEWWNPSTWPAWARAAWTAFEIFLNPGDKGQIKQPPIQKAEEVRKKTEERVKKSK